ncbi:hypothetical protein ACPW96_16830 [Micromonospora sp. DT81.3]|uniref:hypothetical protein n=1 Tax=Micromonospora sp. DT81.3 TaxID=3416523 RepID=UPI003CF10F7C
MLVVTVRLFLGAEADPFAVKQQRMLELPAVGADVALTPPPGAAVAVVATVEEIRRRDVDAYEIDLRS